MVDKTTILKIAFTLSAIFFLFVFVSAPKTDCQACKFEYEGRSINGHTAFKIYKEACIDYRAPWDAARDNLTGLFQLNSSKREFYVDLDDINVSQNGSLSWDPDDELTREDVDKLTE